MRDRAYIHACFDIPIQVFTAVEGNYTEKADIYSCALIMWEIATGKHEYEYVSMGLRMNSVYMCMIMTWPHA